MLSIFKKEYIFGLDLLRGLCAILVATYHILGWEEIIDFTAIGYYGVYIFFVLSGFAIHYQYADKLEILTDLKYFYVLRVARLLPLLFITIILQYINSSSSSFSYNFIILTLSLLFGFGMPGATSTVTGGWSLGIEFGFYIMYPLLMIIIKSWRTFLLFFVFFGILRFSFIQIAYHSFQNYFWFGYTQILPFLFFFFSGMGLAKYFLEKKIKTHNIRNIKYMSFFSVPVLFTLFVWYNVPHIYILNGFNGFFLSFYCILIVFIFSFLKSENSYIKSIYKFLGEISYGVYLLHPIMYLHIKALKINFQWKITCVIIISSACAWVIKYLFEDPIRNYVRKSIRAPKIHRGNGVIKEQ